MHPILGPWQQLLFSPSLGPHSELNTAAQTVSPLSILRATVHPLWCQIWVSDPQSIIMPHFSFVSINLILHQKLTNRSQGGEKYSTGNFKKRKKRALSCTAGFRVSDHSLRGGWFGSGSTAVKPCHSCPSPSRLELIPLQQRSLGKILWQGCKETQNSIADGA